MKKMMIALMAVLITVALAGIGTYAYFSDTAETPVNTISAGTVVLEANGTGTTWWTVSNIKPGDVINGSVTLANTGSLPIGVVQGNVEITEDIAGLSNVIQVTGIRDSYTPTGSDDVSKFLGVWDHNGDGMLSLAEYAEGWSIAQRNPQPIWNWALMGDWGNTNFATISVGGTVQMWIDMRFMTSTDLNRVGSMNEYQAATLKFKLNFMALQTGAPMPSSSTAGSPSFWSY